MPEVIDLLSSSPPRPTVTTATVKRHSIGDPFDFGSDDFDITGDLDFAIDPPAKKRRLTPPIATNVENVNQKANKDAVYELSSEPDDLPPPLNPVSNLEATSATNASNFDDNYHVSFSSSAPEPLQRKPTKISLVLELSSDHDIWMDDPIETSSQPRNNTRPVFSERTANLLANVRNVSVKSSTSKILPGPSRTARATSLDENRSDRFRKSAEAIGEDIFDSSQPEATKKKTKKSSGKTEGEKDAKAAAKAAKDAEKELEKERKKLEKEEKQQEKQKAADIAEANKSKTNKKNSTPEMVVEMPSSLRGKSLAKQVEEYMKELGVDLTYANDEEVSLLHDTELFHGAVIRWKRNITAEYDEDDELWRPLQSPRISTEDHVLIYFKAEELITLAVAGNSPHADDSTKVPESTMKANLDTNVAVLKSQYPNCRLIYLIEGLTAWNKRAQNAKNRAYTAAVRSQCPPDSTEPPPSTQSRSKASTSKRKATTTTTSTPDISHITEETTEALLLHLQLHHQPLQIHHTTSPTTSAAQISTFTQHLSTRPYRLAQQTANLQSASFCMTTGQIRTGATANETWVQMLQEINRVTPSMAYGIVAAGYQNPTDLVRGFRNHGRAMLEDVRKSVNKDGGWSDRRLGPMVSKRVYKVFMGKDPTARDGIA